MSLQALHSHRRASYSSSAQTPLETRYTWHRILWAISPSSKPRRQIKPQLDDWGEEHWVMCWICHALAASMYLWYGAHLGLHSWPAPGHRS